MTTSTMQDKKKRNRKGEQKIFYYGSRILSILLWIGVWQGISMKLGQEILLVSPVSVVKRLGQIIFTGDFWQTMWFSFERIIGGFLLALFLGAFLAVLASRFTLGEILLDPVITVVKSTPIASIIILCLIWIPSRNLSVFISFLIVLPVVYTNLLEGIRQTDRELLEMAQIFNVPLGRRIFQIYLSQTAPYLVSACTLSLGLCWKAGVAAEVIGIPGGSMGEKLYNAKIYLNTPDLFSWTIVIIAISFLFEKGFLWLLEKLEEKIERM